MKPSLRLWVSAALSLAAASALPAASAEQTGLAVQLDAARLNLSARSDGAFEGDGWERILADGERAQFFVVGEQHGVADILALETALHAALARRGYTHAALEMGPYSTVKVERLVRSGAGALEAYVRPRERTWLFPFLGWKEEVRLAEQYVRLSPAKQALWGLDQEYVGSAPILLELLRPRANTAAQRAAVVGLAAASAANPELVKDLRAAGLQPLAEAFAKDPRALRIIADYRLSGEIYAPFTTPGGKIYPANLARENYMKRNFAEAFARAERAEGRPPKVFMKLGGNHAMRGFSASTVPALGNFLAEWGMPRDLAALTVMVDCVADRPNPPCQPYFGTGHALYAAASADKYTLFDLRPLRANLRALPALDAQTRDLIQAFDYYVLIRDVSRATPVRPRPTAASPPAASQAGDKK
jgi:hypothetical protein